VFMTRVISIWTAAIALLLLASPAFIQADEVQIRIP